MNDALISVIDMIVMALLYYHWRWRRITVILQHQWMCSLGMIRSCRTRYEAQSYTLYANTELPVKASAYMYKHDIGGIYHLRVVVPSIVISWHDSLFSSLQMTKWQQYYMIKHWQDPDRQSWWLKCIWKLLCVVARKVVGDSQSWIQGCMMCPCPWPFACRAVLVFSFTGILISHSTAVHGTLCTQVYLNQMRYRHYSTAYFIDVWSEIATFALVAV